MSSLTDPIDPTEIDVQARSILEGLRILERVLEKPIAREALAIAKNADTAARHQLLSRLTKSLTQYLERRGDLYYVGLLGHFSTGKSSTINSLLDIWDKLHERKTGLNPTDTYITLITQEKNSTSILGVIREGHVPIRLQTVEAPLLSNIVIADTPGTGDPQLIEEIARDFLPICDVILFLFSAASPLDKTDVPLLLELHKRLPFIPVKFVVTRSDELIIDRAKPLSEENIDPAKRTHFLAEVVSRINQLLSPQTYVENNILLIDNKSRYNIEKLARYLLQNSDPANPQSRIVMHGHKLHYYATAAKELRDFFDEFLSGKLDELTKIVAAAEKNVGRYNELVRISNDNLTRAWIDQNAAINRSETEGISDFLDATELPPTTDAFQAVLRQRSEAHTASLELAQSMARVASSKMISDGQTQLRSYFGDVLGLILRTSMDEMSAGSHSASTFAFHPKLSALDLMPQTRLSRLWFDNRSINLKALELASEDIRQKAQKSGSALHSRQVIVACQEQVAGSIESLQLDLARFFETVELYRTGVFSTQTKESIATLGIGRQLDALEIAFDEADKGRFSSEAIAAMFPDYTINFERAANSLSTLDARCRALLSEMRTTKLSAPMSEKFPYELELAEVESRIVENRAQQLQVDVNQIVGKVTSSIVALLSESRSNYDKEFREAKRLRRNRYLLVILAGGVVPLLFYLAYIYLKGPVAQTLFATIAWGVLSSLIGDGLGYLLVRTHDTFPKTIKDIQEDFKARIERDVRSTIESGLNSHQFMAADEQSLTTELLQAYKQVIAMGYSSLQQENAATLSLIRQHYLKYQAIRRDVVSAVQDLTRSCAKYFNDSAHNLAVLNDVARRIKQRAIEPSSELLRSTRSQLNDVKESIEAVEFS